MKLLSIRAALILFINALNCPARNIYLAHDRDRRNGKREKERERQRGKEREKGSEIVKCTCLFLRICTRHSC